MKFINRHLAEDSREKGFTLAELLIVVAIIAVLVAVAIPVFTTQLENARDVTTLANLRTAYAEASTALITNIGMPAGTSTITAEGVSIEMPYADQPLYDGMSTLVNHAGAIHVFVPGVSLHGKVTGINIELNIPFSMADGCFEKVFNDKPGKYNLYFDYISEVRDYSYLPGASPVEGTTELFSYDWGHFELMNVEPVS